MRTTNDWRRKYFVGMKVGGVEIIGDECRRNSYYLVRCQCGKEYESQITKTRIGKNMIMCSSCRKWERIRMRSEMPEEQGLNDQKRRFCYMIACANRLLKGRNKGKIDIDLKMLRQPWQQKFRQLDLQAMRID